MGSSRFQNSCSKQLVAAIWFAQIFASSGDFAFQILGDSFECGGNLQCRKEAHLVPYPNSPHIAGPLSLIWENVTNQYWTSGSAFFSKPVRMRDGVRAASFNTSFVVSQIDIAEVGSQKNAGDGIAFVLMAGLDGQAPAIGAPGEYFGCFRSDGTNSAKSVIVEFDNYYNDNVLDIGWNHISVDIQNITHVVASRNASDVSIELWNMSLVYSWVEYRNEDSTLEVRISYHPTRPVAPFLTYGGNLFESLEEYMWVGFSAGTGGWISYYYVGNWTFFTSGIAASGHKTHRTRLLVAIVVGIVTGVLLLVLAGLLVLLYSRRRQYVFGFGSGFRWKWLSVRNSSDGHPTLSELSELPEAYRFSYKQLSVATGGFCPQSKLGQGGFGSVHRGVLAGSGVRIAVKKINRESDQGEKEFIAEVSVISQLRHRNLIHLLGWATDRGRYLIAYELMPHGSLDKVLFRRGSRSGNGIALTWPQRLKIIVGTAEALDYLHQGCRQQVIHRDIKSSNILLDDEWNPKLGDFGLARLVDHQRTASTTLVAGTVGYLAPEAIALAKFTDKSDVYGFGAVVLEIVCGRHALDQSLEEKILVDWVWKCLGEDRLLSVVDNRLEDDYDSNQARKVLALGVLCSHPEPPARPSMRHVVQILAGNAQVPPIPSSKPIIMYGTSSDTIAFADLKDSSGVCPQQSESELIIDDDSFRSTQITCAH